MSCEQIGDVLEGEARDVELGLSVVREKQLCGHLLLYSRDEVRRGF